MSKSLIRKNQLHPDIGDLVTGYGSSIFVKSGDFTALSQSLFNIVNLNRSITVLTTGDQTISGLKNFATRLTVNNSGVLLQGEEAKLPSGLIYTTGTQTITSQKDFTVRPTVNNTGVLLQGEEAKLPSGILYTTGSQTITGQKNFTVRPTFNNIGLSTLEDFKLNFIYINSGTTVSKNTKIGVDTRLSGFSILLPTSNLSIGDVIEVIDINQTFDTKNLGISGTIENSTAGLTCNVKGAHFNLIYVGGSTGWKLSIIDNNFSKAGVLLQEQAPLPSNIVYTTGTQNITSQKNFTIRPTFNNSNLATTEELNYNVIPLLYLNIQENNNDQLFDTNDVQNYKIPWNNIEYYDSNYVAISSTIDNTKFITYNPANKNIYFKESGVYNVDLRYSSYNLRDSSDFLRARLRSWDEIIPGGLTQSDPILDVGFGAGNPPPLLPYSANRPRVLASFAQGPIGTTFNGEAMCAGFTTFKITTPQYVVADFLHAGALRVIDDQPDQPWGYPVYLGPYGNIPFMFISKII
jgi:hypothetical protein